MPDLSNILAFLKAVLWTHLVPVMISLSVPPIVEWTYKKFTGNSLPYQFHLRWIILVGALITIFLAWNDEYTEKLALKQKEARFDATETQVGVLRDSLKQAQDQIVDLRISHNELKRDKKELELQLAESEKSYAAQVLALKEANSEKKRQVFERNKRRSIREQLARYIEYGEALKLRCAQGENTDDIRKDGDAWVNRVVTYLTAFFDSSYRIQFANPPPYPPISHSNMTPANDSMWIALDRHIGVLRKFLSEVKD